MDVVITGKTKLNENCELAVLAPGFLGYKEEEHIVSLSKKLNNIDVPSIAFTPTGFFLSDGFLSERYNLSQFYKDLSSLIDKTQKTYSISNENIVLIGFSVGGIVSTKYSARNKIKALISVSSPFQQFVGDDLSKLVEQMKKQKYLEFNSSKLGKVRLPLSYYQDSQKYNSLDYINEVKAPKLFIAGKEDTNVPKEATKEIYRKAKEPKKLVLVDDMNHKYKHDKELTRIVNSHIMNFIKSLN